MEYGIYLLLALLILFIIYGRIEWLNHQKNLKSIPLRIVVNGTRGKSTVTRLLGAALKGAGYKTLAKTTGTKPRMVIDNIIELPVIRPGKPNIHEQLTITNRAVKEKVDAIVFENMSIRPDLQWFEETKIIVPHFVVITNVRADHLEIMGPTLKDIARNFINAVPSTARIFTAEKALFSILKEFAKKRRIEISLCDEEEVTEEELKNFPYFEHRENVALVLGICKYLGIPRDKALNEMYRYIPDAGILRKYDLRVDNKNIVLFNALAANDPDSTYLIYERIKKPVENFYVLVNCRSDRIDRSVQMAELISTKIKADHFFITGGGTDVLYRIATKKGMPSKKLSNLGNRRVEFVFRRIIETVKNDGVILAIGNIVGYGEQLIEYFKKQGTR
ncbi:MAG: poly-gamma-glutamate synthase PgsB [bacterium]